MELASPTTTEISQPVMKPSHKLMFIAMTCILLGMAQMASAAVIYVNATSANTTAMVLEPTAGYNVEVAS